MITLLQVVVGSGGQTPAPEVIQVLQGNTMPSGAVFALIMAGLVAGVIVLWPLIRAFARRIESRGEPDQALLEEMDQLRQRVGQLEELQHRVNELEERAEFAERLLAQQREPERLPGRTAN